MLKFLLPLVALVSAAASLIGYGLSAMASDDISRPTQARIVQLLQLAWFATSVATPFVAAFLGRHNEVWGHRAYIPMVLVAATALAALASY